MSRLISRRSNDDFPVLRSPHNITTGGGAPTDRAASTSRQTSSTPSSHAAGITAPNRTISPGGTAAGRSPSESGSGQAKAPSESARGGVRTIAARPADRPALVQLDCLSSARPASSSGVLARPATPSTSYSSSPPSASASAPHTVHALSASVSSPSGADPSSSSSSSSSSTIHASRSSAGWSSARFPAVASPPRSASPSSATTSRGRKSSLTSLETAELVCSARLSPPAGEWRACQAREGRSSAPRMLSLPLSTRASALPKKAMGSSGPRTSSTPSEPRRRPISGHQNERGEGWLVLPGG
eukprot:scaffold156752_cov33-Tisochrysis_lutea.AAC.1